MIITKRFDVVECSGTPYEIGLQMGEGCKRNINEALEGLSTLAYMFQTSRESVTSAAMKYLEPVKDFDPDLIDMIEGQAAGAGVDFRDVFSLKCGFDMSFYYPYLSCLCTSFAVKGKATKMGKTLLGQNIDWFPGTPMDVVRIIQADGSIQLSLVLWGVVEYTINYAGYGICANGTWSTVDNFTMNLPVGCYLPKVMRQKTLDEGFTILTQKARGLGYYHLASAGGQVIGIESVNDDYETIYPQNDILVHSNHYLTERFTIADMVHSLVPDSLSRIGRIKTLIDEHYGELTPEILANIMSDHDSYPNSICRHLDPSKPAQFASGSIASFIMIPEDRTMLIACGNPCQSEYIEYKI